ncbi:MAG TPA: acyltransferase, partial [Terriglobales bacterium]|nr:acyltransferase [Terriglobales bacterium]
NPQRASLPRALLAALTFHVNWLEAHRGYLPAGWDVLWSLSNEEVFYFLFPLLCVVTRSRLMLIGVLLGFVMIGPSARTVMTHNRLWADYGYLSAMDIIAIGCLGAMMCRGLPFSAGERRAMRISGGALVACLMVFRGQVEQLGIYKTGIDATLLALGTVLMLISFAQSAERGSRMTAPLRWFGRNSYEIYLTHMMAIFALLPFVIRFDSAGGLAPLWYALMIALSGWLGALLAKYFSEPMNRKLRATAVKRSANAGAAG